jgi:hypothetical protein
MAPYLWITRQRAPMGRFPHALLTLKRRLIAARQSVRDRMMYPVADKNPNNGVGYSAPVPTRCPL